MQASYAGDRRSNEQHMTFPLEDNEGRVIHSERRSGKDRRKNKRDPDVAGFILDIVN